MTTKRERPSPAMIWAGPWFFASVAVLLCCAAAIHAEKAAAPGQHPTMREFMGLNVHTVQFKRDLYAPVCRRLRDYHPLGWDVAEDPAIPTKFPMAANGVDWETLYGGWNKSGFEVDACLMFDGIPPEKWDEAGANARAYGEAFARSFGPSGKYPVVTSVEIGNEPAKYSQAQYRTIFQGMAKGVRAGDPKLTIATCAVMTGKPDEWSKPMEAIAGLEPLYDALNVHSYPFKDKWPTWRRSYPEDPSIRFLKDVNDVVAWSAAHAPGKQIWLTEFGYDSATAPPKPGPWEKWVGVTDEQQAQYIVRSFLVLSSTRLDRAYLYFFDDKDEAQLHGASGITRNFKPKPSFYAMSQLYRTLGDYRFAKAVKREEDKLFCFEYQHAKRPADRIYVAWSPTGDSKDTSLTLPIGAVPAGVYRAERMAMDAAPPKAEKWRSTAGGIEMEVGASPVFIWAK